MSVFKKCKDLRKALADAGLPFDYKACTCCGRYIIPRQHNLRPLLCNFCIENCCECLVTDENILIKHKPKHDIRLFHSKDLKAQYNWSYCHYVGVAADYAKRICAEQNREDEVPNNSTAVSSWVKQPPDGKYMGVLYEVTAIIVVHRGRGKVAIPTDLNSIKVLEDPTKWEEFLTKDKNV